VNAAQQAMRRRNERALAGGVSVVMSKKRVADNSNYDVAR